MSYRGSQEEINSKKDSKKDFKKEQKKETKVEEKKEEKFTAREKEFLYKKKLRTKADILLER